MHNEKAWAIIEPLSNGNHYLCKFTVSETRKDAIEKAKKATGYVSWPQLKRDKKLKVIQIEIFWEAPSSFVKTTEDK